MKTDETIRFLESEKAEKLMAALYGEKSGRREYFKISEPGKGL